MPHPSRTGFPLQHATLFEGHADRFARATTPKERAVNGRRDFSPVPGLDLAREHGHHQARRSGQAGFDEPDWTVGDNQNRNLDHVTVCFGRSAVSKGGSTRSAGNMGRDVVGERLLDLECRHHLLAKAAHRGQVLFVAHVTKAGLAQQVPHAGIAQLNDASPRAVSPKPSPRIRRASWSFLTARSSCETGRFWRGQSRSWLRTESESSIRARRKLPSTGKSRA
jgi:hypothetical protein